MIIEFYVQMSASKIVSVLLLLVLINISSNNINGVNAFHKVIRKMQSKSTSLEVVSHLHRTGFHFQPPRHWINGTLLLIVDVTKTYCCSNHCFSLVCCFLQLSFWWPYRLQQIQMVSSSHFYIFETSNGKNIICL